ncbi:MAG: SCO family protein [Rhizomicrobium sp.]
MTPIGSDRFGVSRRGAIRSLAAVLVASSVLASRGAPGAPFAIDGRFSLTGTDGRTITDRDFRGKWQIVYFGYTFCPDVCPATLAEVTNALAELGPRARDVQPIFITLDPARDSAKVLDAYLKAFDSRFVGLRGDPETTEALARQFHVYFRLRGLGNGEYTVDHSSFLYIFDPKGAFVEVLTGDLPGHALRWATRPARCAWPRLSSSRL